MTEERCYPVSREYLLNVISDIIELQNGKNIATDSAMGRIEFSVRMYGFVHEYHFSVVREDDCCRMAATTDGDSPQDKHRLGQMLALLESLMRQPALGDGP